MRRNYLFVDPRGADIYYMAPGNVAVEPSGQGTLVVWAWASSLRPGQKQQNRIVRIVSDTTNELVSALHNENFFGWAVYDGNGARTFVGPSDLASDIFTTGRAGWNLLAVSWDFSTGYLRVFVNDSYDSGWVECGAPAASALRLYLGPRATGDMADPAYIHWLAAWSGHLTAVQIAELYKRGPRYIPSAGNGQGSLTFLATFNSGYGADVASGDGTLYTDACPSPDRYCLLPDGLVDFARQSYFFGIPTHDGSDNDRKPLFAVLHPGFSPESYSVANSDTEAKIDIPQDAQAADENRGPVPGGAVVFSGADRAALAPVRPIEAGCSVRMRLRVDSDAAPAGQRMRLGFFDYIHAPIADANVYAPDGYGSWQTFRVVDDAANTAQAFKTDLDEGEGFWDGAWCLFLTGPNAGRVLKVSSYDATTGLVQVDGSFAQAPQAGDVGLVAHWARLAGVDSQGNLSEWQTMPVILDETHGTANNYFPEVEWLYVQDNIYDADYLNRDGPCYVRYDRGAWTVLEGIAKRGAGATDASAVFGRPAGVGDPASFRASVRLQKMEILGPWQYQVLRAEGEVGPSLADCFMIWRSTAGEKGLQGSYQSVKVWRQEGVELCKQSVEKWPNPSEVQADLCAAGTWREQCSVPVPVEERGDEVVCLVRGTDASGKTRLGYIVGRWDAQTGRISWQDETPPEGRSNPFMDFEGFTADEAADTPAYPTGEVGVFELPDGRWALWYTINIETPDHFVGCMLIGAEDRWSFDRGEDWWAENPICGINGGVELPLLCGGGVGPAANRDAGWVFLHDRHTEYPSRRYLAYARGKTHSFAVQPGWVNFRPLVMLRSSDMRSWQPITDGAQLTPTCSPLYHHGGMFVLDDSTLCLSLRRGCMRVSEDGVHWRWLFGNGEFLTLGDIDGEGTNIYVLTTFRLGDKRVYYYNTDLGPNLAWIRYNGETYYALQDEQTDGFVETAAIKRPEEGWQRELIVNAAPMDGEVKVEIVDAETEEPIAGFTASDCDPIPDDVEHPVRWNGLGLSEITAEYIRIRFYLSRPDATVGSPRLFAWRLARWDPPRPEATDLKVEGAVNPAGVTKAQPTFSWTYSDPRGKPQTAYRILVATSEELLEPGKADVWDSGVVESSATQAQYAGPALESYRVYFWKVLVRNSEGVWSQ